MYDDVTFYLVLKVMYYSSRSFLPGSMVVFVWIYPRLSNVCLA